MAIQTVTFGLDKEQLQSKIAEVLLRGRMLGNNEFPFADMRGVLEHGLRVLASSEEVRSALESMQEVGMIIFDESEVVRLPK